MPFLVRAKAFFSGQEDMVFEIWGSECPWRKRVYVFWEKFCPRSSLREPITSVLLHFLHCHTGKGVPQYRSLENAQSLSSFNHSPMLPFLICEGIQFMESLFLRISFFTFCIFTNHPSFA